MTAISLPSFEHILALWICLERSAAARKRSSSCALVVATFLVATDNIDSLFRVDGFMRQFALLSSAYGRAEVASLSQSPLPSFPFKLAPSIGSRRPRLGPQFSSIETFNSRARRSVDLTGSKMDTSDPNVQRAVRNINATRKTPPFPWTRDEPYSQPYYIYSPEKDAWLPQQSTGDDAGKTASFGEPPTKTIVVYIWNIDFMLPLATERMSVALSHLESVIFSSSLSRTEPTIILLQEVLADDLILMQSTPWIRKHFQLTDLDPKYWESGYYGTVSLISKTLPISSVFRVHYSQTKMERDGLFVDIALSSSKQIRICNTHLESLAMDPPLRPAQLAVAATFMHPPQSSASFSLLAGDLNAIQPFDRTLHSDNKLIDAHLALGGTDVAPNGIDDAAAGYTWGQTAPTRLRSMFGCSRMDKVLYCGEGVKVKSLERFGWDVVLENEEEAEELMRQGLDRAWVTDHLGLRCKLEVE